MRKSSIHIEKGNLGYCFHNTRQKPTANAIFDAKNEYKNDALTAIEIYREELKKRTKKYTENTGKKLPKNTITHLSAIVNLDERHTLEDVKKIAKYLEESLGTKVFQIAVHKDEGYIDVNEKKHVNYHAHIEMLGLDEEGRSVRKKLTKSYLIELQSETARLLNMQRGVNYTKEKKKRPKRLDTYEYKEHARRQHVTVSALKQQLSELRRQLIERNRQHQEAIYTQEDYKRINELKKQLNAKNVDEIAEKIEELKQDLRQKELENEELREIVDEEIYNDTFLIEKKSPEIEVLEELEKMKQVIFELKKENKQLKEEIKSLTNTLLGYDEDGIPVPCEIDTDDLIRPDDWPHKAARVARSRHESQSPKVER